jgi:hypothetical protein
VYVYIFMRGCVYRGNVNHNGMIFYGVRLSNDYSKHGKIIHVVALAHVV